MRRLLPVAAIALLSGLARSQQSVDFKWLTDLEASRAAAKKEGKPLLVVFR